MGTSCLNFRGIFPHKFETNESKFLGSILIALDKFTMELVPQIDPIGSRRQESGADVPRVFDLTETITGDSANSGGFQKT